MRLREVVSCFKLTVVKWQNQDLSPGYLIGSRMCLPLENSMGWC